MTILSFWYVIVILSFFLSVTLNYSTVVTKQNTFITNIVLSSNQQRPVRIT